eukprot:snap_masked-scaffold_11-processed-gene-12.32-mRNA-1 protein AED:1.00 eAED:1.00 QI:0/-1/0/0/-1/1/1/0/668
MNTVLLFSTFWLIHTVFGQYFKHTDLTYGPNGRNKLDLYIPSSNTYTAPVPTVLYVHGGNWSAGDKSEVELNKKLLLLTTNGFAVAAINYRYSSEAIWEAQLNDFYNALEYLSREHIAESYGLDTDNFAIWGDGAGGHIGLMGSLSPGATNKHNVTIQMIVTFNAPTDLFHLRTDAESDGVDGSELSPEAEETLLGVERSLENKHLFDAASPVEIINQTATDVLLPVTDFFLAFSENDKIVSPYQTPKLIDAIELHGGWTSRGGRFVQGGGHSGEKLDAAVAAAVEQLLYIIIGEDFRYHLVSDLSYGGDENQVLDLYHRPFSLRTAAFPIIFYVHDGDWIRGDKSEVLDYNRTKEALLRGYAVASINMRLSPSHTYPSQLEDLVAAYQLLVSNKEEYNLDVENFAVWGEGSGAYLGAMRSLLSAFHDPGFKPSVVISWFGYTSLTTLLDDFEDDLIVEQPPYVKYIPAVDPEKGSPMEQFMGESFTPENAVKFWFGSPVTVVESLPQDEKTADFLLVHGTEDAAVSPLQTLRLFNALKENNSTENLVVRLVRGNGHGGKGFFNETVVTLDFIDRSLGRGNFSWDDNNDDIEEILTHEYDVADEEPVDDGTSADCDVSITKEKLVILIIVVCVGVVGGLLLLLLALQRIQSKQVRKNDGNEIVLKSST